jgi:hypothetical protein
VLKAQSILERIQNRDLYRCVEYKVFDWEHHELLEGNITPDRIVEEAKLACSARAASGQPATGVDDNDDISPEDIGDLTPEKVIVSFATMHYGMKEKNPLDFVKFYSKNRPNGVSYALELFRTIVLINI